eukprot:m.242173 g.242173  ORF g.242173 m.242173 type:complete len:128 (+) comp40214_c0_seq6:1-384(+)
MEDETIYYESNAFYTSEPGHHMKLCLYPNQHSSGYVGLYLGCVKGDYDSVIKWPFRRKFRLILVNQRVRKNDKEVSVTEEELEEKFCSCYNKPDGTRIGCSKLIQHDEIGEFTKEDTLFAKVVIYRW